MNGSSPRRSASPRLVAMPAWTEQEIFGAIAERSGGAPASITVAILEPDQYGFDPMDFAMSLRHSSLGVRRTGHGRMRTRRAFAAWPTPAPERCQDA